MVGNPPDRPRGEPFRLAPFRAEWAELVVSWVRDAREAYWLAPKTPPPLTAAHVLGWQEYDRNPFVLLDLRANGPVGYGELNALRRVEREYWIGHLIIDAKQRGHGYGTCLTRLLLEEAFEQRGARRVSLVVFPENEAALACYRAAGMREDGHEWHMFPAYSGRVCLLRLAHTRF